MKKSFSNLLSLGFFLLLCASPLCAQTQRYVTAARLELSIGVWTLAYLNGHKVIERDFTTYSGPEPSHPTHDFMGDELCWFQASNTVSFELNHTLEKIDPSQAAQLHNLGARLGVAYILTVTFSDNTTSVFTSSETGKTLNLQTDGKTTIVGWAAVEFSDSTWTGAALIPPPPNMEVKLPDPLTHSPALVLGAWKNDDQLTQHVGEVWHFRRNFPLTTGIRPGCMAPHVKKAPPTATPKPMPPTATPTIAPPTATFTPMPKATNTPIPPKPTATLKPTATPKPPPPTATPLPAPTARPTIEIKKPTPIPIATKKVLEIPPTATLPPVKVKTIEEPPTLTPTPTIVVGIKHKPTATLAIPPTATFTPLPTDTPVPEEIEIEVPNPPVNIDANFADGPGQYKVEIVDVDGNHLVTVYDKYLTYRKETWVSWEGKNDQGTLMGPGKYYAIFTKDGNLMRKIALNWIAPNP